MALYATLLLTLLCILSLADKHHGLFLPNPAGLVFGFFVDDSIFFGQEDSLGLCPDAPRIFPTLGYIQPPSAIPPFPRADLAYAISPSVRCTMAWYNLRVDDRSSLSISSVLFYQESLALRHGHYFLQEAE
eukprot:scaffold2980_cov141-Skeletonema_menzelii.AAC.4